MKPQPPRLASRLFEWYCRNASVEDLHGDAEELFYADLEHMSVRRAKLAYWKNVFSLMFSYTLKKRKQRASYHVYSQSSINFNMISHYVKIAVRNMLKNKAFSTINIFGLSIAITSCVLLTLFIQNELSYDRFPDAERTYRLTSTMRQPNGTETSLQRSSPPIGPALAAEFPEIESQTRVVKDLSTAEQMLKYKEQTFFEKRGYQVEGNFLEMFPYAFKEGNPATALKHPWSIVLSEELAQKIFGDKPALNELIAVPTNSESGVFKVTGVIKRNSFKSHLDADFYMSGLEQVLQPFTTWATSNFVFTYVKLKNNASSNDLIAKFPALMARNGDKENQAMGRKKILGLQHLPDVRLYSRHFNHDIELGTSGSIVYVYTTGAIGFLILVLASINFINLTTAKATQRANEIGVRKAIGAQRTNLFLQFIGESMAIAFVSMWLALVLIYLLLPFFNQLVQKDIVIGWQNLPFVMGALFAFAGITGLLAGIYPSLVLSSFDAVKILKDKQLRLGSSQVLRKGLIAFQFSISIILISCIITIHNQFDFIQHRPLGFDALHKIMIPLRTSEATSHYLQFKNELKSIPGVEAVTASSNSPSTQPVSDWNFYPKGKTENDGVSHFIITVDENYFGLMSIPTVMGRGFSFPDDAQNQSTDLPRKVMINRTSLMKMGIDPAQAAGTVLGYATNNSTFEIVGVVEDFHQFSLHDPINPLLFITSMDTGQFRQSIVALSPEYTETTLLKIKEAWSRLIPDTPFESEVLNDSVLHQYENDKRVSLLVTYSTLLAIIISCLGLYGLSIFVAENRTKEIGIRKVLGASSEGIVLLLSKEFLQILLISFLVATPVSYFASKEWLKNFAYQTEVGPGTFLIAGLLSFLIVMIAVGYESYKAAKANPVNSLKSE